MVIGEVSDWRQGNVVTLSVHYTFYSNSGITTSREMFTEGSIRPVNNDIAKHNCPQFILHAVSLFKDECIWWIEELHKDTWHNVLYFSILLSFCCSTKQPKCILLYFTVVPGSSRSLGGRRPGKKEQPDTILGSGDQFRGRLDFVTLVDSHAEAV